MITSTAKKIRTKIEYILKVRPWTILENSTLVHQGCQHGAKRHAPRISSATGLKSYLRKTTKSSSSLNWTKRRRMREEFEGGWGEGGQTGQTGNGHIQLQRADSRASRVHGGLRADLMRLLNVDKSTVNDLRGKISTL